jgi:uncharacterized protein with HEPN domain
MSKRNNALLVDEILLSIDRIFLYIQGITETEFLTNFFTQDAVARNFEIIGEASSRLSAEFKEKYNNINWVKVKDFRNKLIHDYFGTDYTTVWLIIHNDLKTLQESLIEISKNLSEEN